MNRLIEYIEETIGIKVQINPLPKKKLGSLPMYINELYTLKKINLNGRNCILAEINNQEDRSVAQLEKHFELMHTKFNTPIIALFDKLEAYLRKRLIEKKIAFILVGKQMYIPDFFIDLKEYGIATKKREEKLTATAQQILFMYLLDQYDKNELEIKSFKELASFFNTNAMGITRAVENLKYHDLVDVIGEKEKTIKFKVKRIELWQQVAIEQDLLMNPVLKQIYVEELPTAVHLLQSNASALPEYSDMNPSKQKYYALEKKVYYDLKKNKAFINSNPYEGKYCLEIWNYNSELLTKELHNDRSVVDPLSLYISLKDSHNERIEMSLEQIIEKYIW